MSDQRCRSPRRPSPLLQLQLWAILHALGSPGGLLPAPVSPVGEGAARPRPQAHGRGCTRSVMTELQWDSTSTPRLQQRFLSLRRDVRRGASKYRTSHQQPATLIRDLPNSFGGNYIFLKYILHRMDK